MLKIIYSPVLINFSNLPKTLHWFVQSFFCSLAYVWSYQPIFLFVCLVWEEHLACTLWSQDYVMFLFFIPLLRFTEFFNEFLQIHFWFNSLTSYVTLDITIHLFQTQFENSMRGSELDDFFRLLLVSDCVVIIFPIIKTKVQDQTHMNTIIFLKSKPSWNIQSYHIISQLTE